MLLIVYQKNFYAFIQLRPIVFELRSVVIPTYGEPEAQNTWNAYLAEIALFHTNKMYENVEEAASWRES